MALTFRFRKLTPGKIRIGRILKVKLIAVTFCLIYFVLTNYNENTTGKFILKYETRNTVRFDEQQGKVILKYEKVNTVGFVELQGSDCISAFSNRSKNGDFVKKVERKSLERIRNDSRNCATFRQEYGFNRYPPPTDEEEKFPLAFTILFHKDFDQVLYLLRAVYRPHNVYCLTVDLNTYEEFRQIVREAISCFSNIFLASKMESIYYGGFERLKADVDCMVDLIVHPIKWKYVINMVGQQFPLRSNLEIVRILKLYNTTSDVEIVSFDRVKEVESRFKWKHYIVHNENGTKAVRFYEEIPPPPHNITIMKGYAFASFSREFIQYVLTESYTKAFLEWCRPVYSPDEHYWSSLQFGANLDVPGGYKGWIPQNKYITVFASWPFEDPCSTMRVHTVCIFSPEDLPMLDQKHHLFANKFYISHHPAALHCLDERIYNLTVSRKVRDLSFYEQQTAMIKR